MYTNIDLAAVQHAIGVGTANAESQASNQAKMLASNDMTAAGWHGSASKAFVVRSAENDSLMTMSNQDQHRILEANQQSVTITRGAEDMNTATFHF